jgi:hypothetical protein
VRAPGVAAGPPAHVVVLATLGAPERRRLARARRPAAAEPPVAAVTTTRVTVVDAGTPLAGEQAARGHLRRAGEAEANAAVRVLNRMLHGQRLAARDPYVHEVSLPQAIAVRVGYAAGAQAAEGRLAGAVELPPASRPAGVRRRAGHLRPQEHLAALLGGRAIALVAEEHALRARADLDAGRLRSAALELRAALEAAVAELGAGDAATPERLEELRGLLPACRREAARARAGEPERAAVERILGRLEAAVRARAVALG